MQHHDILSQRDQADLGLGPVKAAAVELVEVPVLLGISKAPLDHPTPPVS
jgi:hypothetical protein